MNSLISRIQGKVIQVKPVKAGYYIAIQEQKTGKHWRAFSQWRPRKGVYSLVLRQNRKYFFIVSWQELETKIDLAEAIKRAKQEADQIEAEFRIQGDICQPFEVKEEQINQQSSQQLRTKVNQLEAQVQQWKNAYYNQKTMLKKAQQNAQRYTVENRIKALERKPGKKSKQDLDYLKLLIEFNRECKENWVWLNSD